MAREGLPIGWEAVARTVGARAGLLMGRLSSLQQRCEPTGDRSAVNDLGCPLTLVIPDIHLRSVAPAVRVETVRMQAYIVSASPTDAHQTYAPLTTIPLPETTPSHHVTSRLESPSGGFTRNGRVTERDVTGMHGNSSQRASTSNPPCMQQDRVLSCHAPPSDRKTGLHPPRNIMHTPSCRIVRCALDCEGVPSAA